MAEKSVNGVFGIQADCCAQSTGASVPKGSNRAALRASSGRFDKMFGSFGETFSMKEFFRAERSMMKAMRTTIGALKDGKVGKNELKRIQNQVNHTQKLINKLFQ